MQCSILTPVLITRYCCQTHPILPLQAPPPVPGGKDFSRSKVCSNPLEREVRARRIYILTKTHISPERESKGMAVEQWNAWKSPADSHLRI